MNDVVSFCLAYYLPEEIWGLFFYFLHKVFCSQYERRKKSGDFVAAQAWRIRSWLAYLTGLPAVVAMFIGKENWIFAALELSGGPLMVLGLIMAMKGRNKEEIDRQFGKLDPLVYTILGFGLGYSCCHFGGFVTLNQWLEITASGGFLAGLWLQAKDNKGQYPAYFTMNTATALLLWRDDLVWFALQQIGSMAFIVDAWRVRKSIN